MSNAVISRQQGDDYQAKFFWYTACQLYQQDSTAVKVAWENNDSPGFDDVSIHYHPAKLDKVTGRDIVNEFFQVKFHVDHDKGFTCAAFMDPSFIGNTTESLLQRLQKNFKKDPSVYDQSLFYIINTWGIDHRDEIKNLLGNDGAIRHAKLFDGTTAKSKMGKIRAAWRTHLGISSDAELQRILTPLRIYHNAKGLDHFTEELNFRLQAVGLQSISETQRASSYTSLIQQLHSEKRNVFTRDELLEILTREKLIAIKAEQTEDATNIGIRSFKKGTDSLTFETEDHLCLLHHFAGRFAIEEALWQTAILPSLVDFADRITARDKPLHIHLDTHQSIALAFGYCLDSKSGVPTKVVQKTRSGRLLFQADHTSDDYVKHRNDINWVFNTTPVNPQGSDVVLAISVTHDIAADVGEFATSNISSVTRIVAASIVGGPSPVSIRDGNHILLAVLELVAKIRADRTADEKKGTLHLLIAAPNAFVFTLGQHIKSLGKIALYEHDFEHYRTGSYSVAIHLPINQ